MIWGMPKAPMSTGTTSTPLSSSGIPKVKRGKELELIPADTGQEQSQKTGDPPLDDQIGAGEGAADQDPEKSQQEKLERGELQCEVGYNRRDAYHEQHADGGADGRSRGGQADGTAALSLAGQGIAIHGRGRGGGGSGDIDQDGGIGAAVGPANIDGQQTDHGQVRVHAVGQGGEQGHA
jgi:hypothetical protein